MGMLHRFETFMKRYLGPAQLNQRKQQVVRPPRTTDRDLGDQGFERRTGPDGTYIVRRGQ
jgi:hypothetical protein